MEKKSIADKMAEKTFHSSTFQKNWITHMQAFGPILEPAFVDNYQAKVHLCAALNFMSQRNAKKGYEKLNLMQDCCSTDADKAAWLFFVGLCFEMSGMKKEMLAYYQQAAGFGHHFYLPYLKVAKSAHNDAVFDMAEENYRLAIQCLKETEFNEQTRIVLGSAYTNLASCLTMMHQYQEAENTLVESKKVLPEQPGREASEAVLYAAMRENERVEVLLQKLEKQNSMLYMTTKEMTDKILGDLHPHFSIVEVDEEKIVKFWKWFVDNEDVLSTKLNENQEYDDVLGLLQTQLQEVFSFMERDLDLDIEPEANGYKIFMVDFFVIALRQGYKELIKRCPDRLKENWKFEITH